MPFHIGAAVIVLIVVILFANPNELGVDELVLFCRKTDKLGPTVDVFIPVVPFYAVELRQ